MLQDVFSRKVQRDADFITKIMPIPRPRQYQTLGMFKKGSPLCSGNL
ncbi:MAG: hypothetical protein ACUVQ5_03220 [Candidatus Methanomethylicaceae archaeon]